MIPDPASTLDIVIVGAGPAGLTAGAQAARRGVSHVVLDGGRMANTIYRYQKRKHVMDEPVVLPLRDEVPLAFRAGTREAVLDAWEQGTKAAGTNVWCGPQYEVTAIEGARDAFVVRLKDGSTLRCRRVVLAIGLQGNLRTLGVPGENLPHVSYQLDDPAEHVGERVVVIGVGDAGIENAVALAAENEVALVNRGEEFEKAKPGNRSLIEGAIRAGKITHYANSRPNRVEERRIVLDTPNGELLLEADLVLGRLGANPPRRFLEALGIEFPSKDPAAVPQVSESYESNVPGIHVIGALAGSPLIKHCMHQGYEVIEYILGHPVVPADEPLLRKKFAGLPGSVTDVLDRIRTTLPTFAGLTTLQLREFLVDSEIDRPKPGEVIFRRNDFSDEFYSILEGAVQIEASATEADDAAAASGKHTPRANKLELRAGSFFGEMSLISGRRRTGTVTAGPGCVLIKTPRLSMNKLIKSVAQVRRTIDETFILRKLQTSLMPKLPASELGSLAQAAVLMTFKQGDALFQEGDASDGLHLIRRGSVTVSRRGGDGETVLAYLPAGNVVGETALLSPKGKRTATVRATVFTETIRLPSEPLLAFLERHRDIEEELRGLESQRLVENAARMGSRGKGDIVGFLMRAGAGEATDILLIDETLCVGCDNCEKACAATHGGVSRLDREAGPTFASIHIPTSCRHCENPKCMTDCPPDALHRHPNGEVFIDNEKCIGCGNCVSNCPYDVIQLAMVDQAPPRNVLLRILLGERAPSEHHGDVAKKAVKCDLCREVPGMTRGRVETACVSSCPTGAILRVDPKSYVDRLLPNE